MSPFTRATALSAGWHWTIPLTSRTGVGYVYSSRHTTDEAAWNELRQATGDAGDSPREPLLLKLRVGRQTTFWKANVVALGLAAGFIEPLESTGLHLTQVAIELLLELLPDRRSPDILRDAYNRRMTRIFDEVRDFVQLHYLLSGRRDTPFWQDATAAPPSDALLRGWRPTTSAAGSRTCCPRRFPTPAGSTFSPATAAYRGVPRRSRLPRTPSRCSPRSPPSCGRTNGPFRRSCPTAKSSSGYTGRPPSLSRVQHPNG